MSGSVRQPRVQVLIGGSMLPGVVSVQLDQNGYLQADRFTIVCALSAAGAPSTTWWGSQTQIIVDILFSLDGGDSFTPMHTGTVDLVQINPIKGSVTITGRDLTAFLIDHQTSESFPNQKPGDIVTKLAARRGLAPMVTASDELTGRYYQSDTSRVSLFRGGGARSEWDVLAGIAQEIDYDLFAQGHSLYFQPLPDPDLVEPFVVNWDQQRGAANVIDLRMDLNMTLAAGVVVTVQSHHSQQGKSITATAGSTNGDAASPREYTINRANLTADKAEALAQSTLNHLLRHQRKLVIPMPGELTLTPRSIIRLDGDVGSWAGPFFPSEISRTISRAGFTQQVTARAVRASAATRAVNATSLE